MRFSSQHVDTCPEDFKKSQASLVSEMPFQTICAVLILSSLVDDHNEHKGIQ